MKPQRGELKQKHNYKLTKQQRNKIVRLYATGEYTQQELGEMYGVSHSNVSHLVSNDIEAFQEYKKQFKSKIEHQLTEISTKAGEHALKNIKKLSPYQAITAVAIAHDKLYPKETNIQVGDNRTMNITFSNFNKHAPQVSPKADKEQ